jgi:hypothetical protein
MLVCASHIPYINLNNRVKSIRNGRVSQMVRYPLTKGSVPLEKAIEDAKSCDQKDKKDCNVAWDIVEELSDYVATERERMVQKDREEIGREQEIIDDEGVIFDL